MLTIRFFSLIREGLNLGEVSLAWSPEISDIAAVKEALVAANSEEWRGVLFQPNVVHALNHKVVRPEHPVADGDEIAFFPPMTGG